MGPAMSEPYFIGIDGGGTRTLGLLTSSDGRVKALIRSGSTNYHVAGEQGGRDNLFSLFDRLLEAGRIDISKLGGVCLGLSGCDRPDDRKIIHGWLEEYGIKERSLVVNDGVIALAGGSLSDTGLLVISGTGSILLARGMKGTMRRLGGWGQLLADEGSGYHLGCEALRAVMRAYDEYGPPTALTELILSGLQLEKPTELVRWSTTEGKDKGKVAALSRQVFEACESGDPEALSILNRLSGQLADMAVFLAGKVELGDQYSIVLAGGNFKHAPVYFEKTRQYILEKLPGADVILPRMQPVVGAILYAMAKAGSPVEDTTLENLKATYPQT